MLDINEMKLLSRRLIIKHIRGINPTASQIWDMHGGQLTEVEIEHIARLTKEGAEELAVVLEQSSVLMQVDEAPLDDGSDRTKEVNSKDT